VSGAGSCNDSGTTLSRRAFVGAAAAAAASAAAPSSLAATPTPLAPVAPAVVTSRDSSPAGATPWRFARSDAQEVPLYDLEVWQAADLLRRRTITPVQLAEAVLARIEAVEPRVNTFANRYPADEVMAAARTATEEIAAGRYRGPLHGIPVGVKDIYLTEGKVTEGNSDLYRGFVPRYDATSVQRLKEAGALLVGKTGTSELATANTWPANNPWDLNRQAGGSSTGSATGVAASQFMIGMGTCTGGSIRGPAANCGITGFKPTYGTISTYGIFPLAWSMDYAGPLAHSARDAALLIDAIGGEDPLDRHTRKVERYQLADAIARANAGARPLQGVVVGVPTDDDYLMGVPNDEQIAAFREAASALRALGATIRVVPTKVLMPGLTSTSSFYDVIRSAEVAAYQRQNLLSQPQNMSAEYLARVSSGVLMPGHAYLQAQRVRRMWRDQLHGVFADVQALIHPADDIAGLRGGGGRGGAAGRAGAAPAAGARAGGAAAPARRSSSGSKTNIWNLSGAPAVAIPTGFSSDERMPLSLQVVAAPGNDEMVLRVADAFQQATAHHKARPRL
jgi:aspartyl-tRNA(Asn)/glutamyl-tRNA(Gln) amidotransferase subunit A